MQKRMKYGWNEHEGNTSFSYQFNFDIFRVLGKISEHNEMMKVQIKNKEHSLREDAIECALKPERYSK